MSININHHTNEIGVSGAGVTTIPPVATYAALRLMQPASGQKTSVVSGSGGIDGDFYAKTGAAPGTYVDNGGTIIVPTLGDGSAAWLRVEKWCISGNDFGLSPSSSDNTSALQSLINFLSNNPQHGAILDAGTYNLLGDVYAYYDVVLNPGFNSGALLGGRILIIGSGQMGRQDYKNNTYVGTVLKFATGKGLKLGNGGTQKTTQQRWEKLSIIGSTPTILVDAYYIPQYSIFDSLFIGNDDRSGTGKALYIRDAWMSQFSNIDIVGRSDLTTPGFGEGLIFEAVSTAGNVTFKNVTGAYFGASSLRFGKPYNVANSIFYNINIIECQGQYSTDGMLIQHGISTSLVTNYWGEGNTNSDLRIDNSAEHIKIVGGKLTSNIAGMTANAIIGGNSGTATSDSAKFITFDGTYFFCYPTAGVRKYAAATDIEFRKCQANNGGACWISVDATEGGEIILDKNNYYPIGAASETDATRRICYVTAGPTYTDYASRARTLDFAAPAVSGTFDMSAWRYAAEEIRTDTTAAAVTVLLPLNLSTAKGRLVKTRIRKPFAANTTTIDTGTGNTIKGAQTLVISAAYSVIGIQHAGPGSAMWDVISN